MNFFKDQDSKQDHAIYFKSYWLQSDIELKGTVIWRYEGKKKTEKDLFPTWNPGVQHHSTPGFQAENTKFVAFQKCEQS